MHGMGKLTTHVLDTAGGKPAGGVGVALYRLLPDGTAREWQAGGGEVITERTTNDDGRIDGALLAGEDFTAGIYELDFAVGDYFGGAGFYDVITVRFVVKDAGGHYHIPLLVSPFGYTTYRGS